MERLVALCKDVHRRKRSSGIFFFEKREGRARGRQREDERERERESLEWEIAAHDKDRPARNMVEKERWD